jgi:hypothetical protein
MFPSLLIQLDFASYVRLPCTTTVFFRNKALKKLGRIAIWKLEQGEDFFAIVMGIRVTDVSLLINGKYSTAYPTDYERISCKPGDITGTVLCR